MMLRRQMKKTWLNLQMISLKSNCSFSTFKTLLTHSLIRSRRAISTSIIVQNSCPRVILTLQGVFLNLVRIHLHSDLEST
jgi:hypothetical protein